ncbi:SPOR domain-containing protein [Syntrophotalea acetylenica]|jgi:cell division septation protein DedD|uniref:SPOR domain-containing protein n=1 Tax=Syntrophotalea TaxID=2812025 RepID=UPI002A3597CF|nr:SPOR domain-containing protein [Syntrophotalea acetylenica]MDY0261886.1 SPOR domain-containing protein [Syntrophotalea acetylenica]
MNRQVVSRSQRRLEKKQTMVLIVLGLIISLVSYGLGVMVGRSGEDNVIVKEDLTTSGRIAIAVPEAGTETGAATAPAEEPAANPALTFYETLPEGTQPPMGSGINLPPQPAEVTPARVDKSRDSALQPPSAVAKPVVAEARPKVSAPKVEPVTAPSPRPVTASAPVTSSGGGFIIQVASVQKQASAQDLSSRLAKSGYAAYVEKTDLGAKGIWYRVYVGPFASRSAADGAASTLKAARLANAPLVKKR